jgi:NNP family nitrate/nitrite transporter-like MFS transporter
MLAGSFGVLAIFARSLGGYLGDRAGRRFGLDGRGRFLTAMLLAEGIGLIAFSRMNAVVPAAITLVAFGLFVHIAAGATYSVVPFIKPNGVGSVPAATSAPCWPACCFAATRATRRRGCSGSAVP